MPVVEPIAKSTPKAPEPLVVFRESFAYGVEEPIPMRPSWLVPETMNAGEVEPWLETINAGWVKLFISSESSPIGVVEPIPIRPIADERVEMLKIGIAVDVVAKVKALSTPLIIVVVAEIP